MTVPGQKGFFGSLFDYSFNSLITTRIIKVVYVLLTIVISLAALGWFIAGIVAPGAGHIFIVIAPIAWLLYMIWARIGLEVLIVVFRIGDDVRRIAWGPGAGPTPPPGYPPQRPAPGPGAPTGTWPPQGPPPGAGPPQAWPPQGPPPPGWAPR